MQRQFTATAYIIKEEKTLLIFHKKLRKWLPPGGHLDPNETPAEAARREVLEETGLEVVLIQQENIWIESPNATSFERPYLCLLENIPEHNGIPAHQHIDFIYVAKPIKGKVIHNEKETEQIRWFSLEEIQNLTLHEEIFVDTYKTLHQLLS